MSRSAIHPTAVVSPKARVAPDVKIGPYAVIEPDCEIESGCEIGPHAVIHAHVKLAAGVKVGAHAVLGGEPQDLGFKGGPTGLEIGANTRIREGVTMHRASTEERPTRVGSDCYFMAYTHIAHDCQVGNGVILTQSAIVAGHCEIGDGVILGGLAGVHQFVRIGPKAMIGGLSKVTRDVLPYALVNGSPALHYRLNAVGLRRAGLSGEPYKALEAAFRAARAGEAVVGDTPEVQVFRAFLEAPSKRRISGFVRGEVEFEF
ncbi:MAG: acyl-ACP--UDP-N-acetylglucosamine O-acyltransferase [Meiothermus sp.]|nr:acyl-ACP--UDP-N-acetylglucosamine O-acyltransferase [Meiothermus sp.]